MFTALSAQLHRYPLLRGISFVDVKFGRADQYRSQWRSGAYSADLARLWASAAVSIRIQVCGAAAAARLHGGLLANMSAAGQARGAARIRS